MWLLLIRDAATAQGPFASMTTMLFLSWVTFPPHEGPCCHVVTAAAHLRGLRQTFGNFFSCSVGWAERGDLPQHLETPLRRLGATTVPAPPTMVIFPQPAVPAPHKLLRFPPPLYLAVEEMTPKCYIHLTAPLVVLNDQGEWE